MKNYQGMCSLKVTSPNGERSKILVSNPGKSIFVMCATSKLNCTLKTIARSRLGVSH